MNIMKLVLNVFRATVVVSRQRSTSPAGHLKDILKERHSQRRALYLPLLTLHAGPTAILPDCS